MSLLEENEILRKYFDDGLEIVGITLLKWAISDGATPDTSEYHVELELKKNEEEWLVCMVSFN